MAVEMMGVVLVAAVVTMYDNCAVVRAKVTYHWTQLKILHPAQLSSRPAQIHERIAPRKFLEGIGESGANFLYVEQEEEEEDQSPAKKSRV